jgi:hypothetical protein
MYKEFKQATERIEKAMLSLEAEIRDIKQTQL